MPSAWRFKITFDRRVIAIWNGASRKIAGDFELAGQHYRVLLNRDGSQLGVVDSQGTQVASADRVGRKRWTVTAYGQTYHFQRTPQWSDDQELRIDDRPAGSVKRTGRQRDEFTADLPGLPPLVQIFVVGIAIFLWEVAIANS